MLKNDLQLHAGVGTLTVAGKPGIEKESTMSTMSHNDATVMTLTEDLAHYVKVLREARELKAAAAKEEKEAREILLAALNTSQATTALVASGGGVTIRTQERTTVDRSKLEALYPEVYAEVLKTSTVTVLNLV